MKCTSCAIFQGNQGSQIAGNNDPVQQKGHDVGQVYSEIMSKTVCNI